MNDEKGPEIALLPRMNSARLPYGLFDQGEDGLRVIAFGHELD